MNILFICDFSISQGSGGAEISNSILINEGRKIGHSITEFTAHSSPILLLQKYDLVISSNFCALNYIDSNRFIYNFIINHPNHVRLEHDSCMYFSNEDRRKLFNSSKKNFFLTNFHIDFFKEFYGDYFGNVEIVYDPIDVDRFVNLECEKIYDIVYCGFLSDLKGANNLIKFAEENKDRHITIFGWSEDNSIINKIKNTNNISLNEKLPHSEIHKIYQKANYIFHSPKLNEPFCMMVAEALLCGCSFIGNADKIGSYKEIEKIGIEAFRKKCKQVKENFWKIINSL
jgi:glycosyltransferase involved in cell wall biosynthesis